MVNKLGFNLSRNKDARMLPQFDMHAACHTSQNQKPTAILVQFY